MQIDRRDAIKKLAVGGATVATASAVISSPAFAYDDPTPPALPVLSAFVDNFVDSRLNVRLEPGAPTCNASATGGASVVAVAQSSSATPASVVVDPTTDSGIDGPLDVTFQRNSLSVSTATIDYQVQYRCTYATGTGNVCRSWTITYTGAFFTVWDTVPASISAPGTTCP